MGKLGRGFLWALFPPAGAVASVRAGQRNDTKKIVAAVERANRPPPLREDRTPGGFRRHTLPDGRTVVELPRKSLKLQKAFRDAGSLEGLTIGDVVALVGHYDDGEPGRGPGHLGYTRRWSQPGYVATVLFTEDWKAMRVISEKIG